MSRNRIVFFGSPDFALPSLEALAADGESPIAVVTQPDRPAGRGRRPSKPPVKIWAEARGIPVLQPERVRRKSFREALAELQPEIGVVVAFGQIIPRSMLELPPLGFINVHASLLPKYRGAAPIQWAVINGEQVSGVTIQRMVAELDAGDVLLQAEIAIGPDETAGELHDRLARLGAELLPQAVAGLRAGTLAAEPQAESAVTLARLLAKEDGRIDWGRDARSVHDHIRGMSPWPGAFSSWQGKRLSVHRARLVQAEGSAGEPGAVVGITDEGLHMACGKGSVALCELQLEGRRRLQCREFVAGCRVAPGDRLGE